MLNSLLTSLRPGSLFIAFVVALAIGSFASAQMPNVVILYSDDAGFADFGFQPDCREDMKSLTPFIDTIARDGVRLSNAYMSGPVCSPSRAGLMTGRYQQRFGYDNNLPPGFESGLDLNETFGAKRMKQIGYTTGLVGKWHLGYPDEFRPNRRGFDSFYGLLQGSRSYYPIDNATPHRVILDNTTPTAEEGYTTDRFGDAACRFITANKDQPFYLFVSFTAPHGPLQPRESDAERIAHIENRKRNKYAGLVVALDDNVGKILACLTGHGLDENTLVIFTNDNGGQTKTGADNTPLRGSKGSMWEGGVRVPWAMRMPGTIRAGSVIDDPVISLDLLPTMIELSGQAVDESLNLDGVSIYKRMTGEAEELPARPFFWRTGGSGGNRAMRLGNWKVVHNRKFADEFPSPMLFDLSVDIGEENDLAEEQPEVLAQMLAALDQWESPMLEPLWGSGSNNAGRSEKEKK